MGGLAASAAAALALVLASCAAPAIEDELQVGSTLPDRDAAAGKLDGGDAQASEAAPPPPPADAASEAATQTALCNEPDLMLCFGFEGAVIDGSPNALVPAVSGLTFGPGKSGQAAQLTASSAMTFAASPAFEVTTATIEAWIKRAPNAPGDGVIFDDDNRASLTILADGSVLCKPSGATSGGRVVSDQWTHVACVFDGINAHVYLDGAEQNVAAGTIGSSPTSTAAVGGNAPSGEPFVGAIDSFRVFRVARTSAQIAAAAAK